MRQTLKSLFIFLVAAIVFASAFLPGEAAAAPASVKWGGITVKKGVVGKVTAVKETTLVKIEKNKLKTIKKIKKGSVYAVYSTKKLSKTTWYNVGSGHNVKKDSRVKYTAVPKEVLAKLNPPSTGLTKVGMVTDVGGVDDKSFNQSTWEGLSKFGKDTGVHFAYKQSKTDADYAKNLEALTKDRYGLIFGVGYLLHEPISSIAIKNKKGKYAIVDSYVNQPNVASVVFKEHEASFLAGVVAGLKTETNNVGFIGGIQSSMIKAYEAGFVAGVKAVNPSAEVAIQYAGSFGAPDKGQAIASAMYSAGSDIIYHASGGTGNGVFAAAKQLKMKDPSQNIWVIGVDRDQHYEGMVKVDGKEYNVTLTSALKKVDVAVYDIASRTKKGQFPGGKAISYGIAENGVDVATANLDYNTIKKVEEYKKKVKSGEIKVPHN